MLWRAASPLRRRKRTTQVAAISTAVTHTSPSPCAKWASPVENSAPSTATGSSRCEPAVSCLTSKLPPVSRGGKVRRPAVAGGPESGTAPAGSGCSTKPPRAAASASRLVHASTCSREGATPETPMNGPAGIRAPGICAVVAQPSAIVQWTRNGVVITSRRKPRPGIIPENAHGCGAISTNSTSSRSPG